MNMSIENNLLHLLWQTISLISYRIIRIYVLP